MDAKAILISTSYETYRALVETGRELTDAVIMLALDILKHKQKNVQMPKKMNDRESNIIDRSLNASYIRYFNSYINSLAKGKECLLKVENQGQVLECTVDQDVLASLKALVTLTFTKDEEQHIAAKELTMFTMSQLLRTKDGSMESYKNILGMALNDAKGLKKKIIEVILGES